uniref:putative receptor-like protein kinase At3g47110 n=1 Tax=Erigeron canadensis TaxID=72917 RepID=UPI001CB987DC|nr:putative receptor-like protein kinase At3g47110 [Erigeron canadensis]
MCQQAERKFFMEYLSFFLHVTALMLLWSPTLSLATNDTDYVALVAIKLSIIHDPQHVLDSWNTSSHFCQWQGVTCGRRHPRVTRLDLQNQGFVGSVSPHIGNLSFMRSIHLTNNTLKGVIPPQLGNLFRLQELYLGINSFEGEVPASLSNWLPFLFGNFTSLKQIYATENYLGGIIPNTLGQLYNLQEIGFESDLLHGTIPRSLYNLTSLKVLSVADNSISGSLPNDIGLKLPNLEDFHIWGNKFNGSIPFTFFNCSNLYKLELDSNSFTRKVNIDFRHMPNLKTVLLGNNSLGSSESDEMNFINSMVNCSQLELLSLGGNHLTGVLPSSIRNLSSQLTILSFEYNLIYGTLPSGIGNLVMLDRLYLGTNQLTGIFPSELGNLRNLKSFFMDDNFFTGNLPKSIGNLSLLLELSLAKNRLE